MWKQLPIQQRTICRHCLRSPSNPTLPLHAPDSVETQVMNKKCHHARDTARPATMWIALFPRHWNLNYTPRAYWQQQCCLNPTFLPPSTCFVYFFSQVIHGDCWCLLNILQIHCKRHFMHLREFLTSGTLLGHPSSSNTALHRRLQVV